MASKRISTHAQSPTETWTDDLPVCKISGLGFLTNQRYREDGGRREEHEFEDRSLHFNVDGTCLYGVFDGHDGPSAADFAAQRLPAELLLGQLTDDMSEEEVQLALRQAFFAVEKGFFQTIDDALAEKTELQLQMPEGLSSYEAYQQYPRQVERIQELQDQICGGTTAVVALIFNNKLYVANAGDSRALLCRQLPDKSLQVEQLSTDHDTQNEEELLRLARLGLDIVQIQRNRRIGSQENTRSIGDYCVKGGYKDFDILSHSAEEPVVADPHIVGGLPIDDSFYALILMSDGVYKGLEEATGTESSNLDIIYMVATELQIQSTLNGVAQAVVDKVGRYHHDKFMEPSPRCQKRDDMTLLVRIFDEEVAASMKSPRVTGRHSVPAFPPMSPGVLPVSVPFNPQKNHSGSTPSLIIPIPQHNTSPPQQQQQQQQQPLQNNQETSTPGSTTSTPTNPTTGGPFNVSSSSEHSSPSVSPSSANPPQISSHVVVPELQRVDDDDDQGEGATEMVEPYVDFTDFYKTVEELGEETVYKYRIGQS